MPRKPKLTKETIAELRATYRSDARPSIKAVAAQFGVSYMTAFNVIHGKGAYNTDAATQALLFPDGEV
jgi:hypothetical protein